MHKLAVPSLLIPDKCTVAHLVVLFDPKLYEFDVKVFQVYLVHALRGSSSSFPVGPPLVLNPCSRE